MPGSQTACVESIDFNGASGDSARRGFELFRAGLESRLEEVADCVDVKPLKCPVRDEL